MICQSAMQQLQPGDVVVVEVGVGSDELGQGRHGHSLGVRGRPPGSTVAAVGWQDGRHGRGRTGSRSLERGLEVPSDRPLDDLTAELTRMLGSTDPDCATAPPTPRWRTWIDRGVYDDLLAGLGDGMAAGLGVGLGENGTDSVFRRSFSRAGAGRVPRPRQRAARCCPAARSSTGATGSPPGSSASATLRGFVPGKGWAHAVAHGADALGALAQSPHLGANELTVLLDVLADRLLLPGDRAAAPPASPTGWPRPRCRSCAATWCRLRGARAVDRPARGRAPARSAAATTATRSSPAGNAAGVPARALPPARARPATRRRSAPTCCWCSSTRCSATNPHYLARTPLTSLR